VSEVVSNWEEMEASVVDVGPFGGRWTNIGAHGGSVNVGVRRAEIAPGRRSTPVHMHTAEEEIFFVLAGSGLSWQDGKTYDIRAGDCLVHLPREEAHTLIAGDDGLDFLVFSTRRPIEACRLPRAGVSWLAQSWVVSGEPPHPWGREVAAGELECPPPEERPSRIVSLDDVAVRRGQRGEFERELRTLGAVAGSRDIGLNHVHLPADRMNYPPHCHSAEEEGFIVLDGRGTLLLGEDEHPLEAGSVVVRPASTGVAHALRGGIGGLTYLAFGERINTDMIWYPRSQKVSFKGLGVMGRVESLEYYDGEV
jgi:uncharacterized cupin superfamily protein